MFCFCFVSCVPITRHLALSTNAIDRIAGLAGLKKLKILSLGRNIIRRIDKLDDVADSLEQLWISYNMYRRSWSRCRVICALSCPFIRSVLFLAFILPVCSDLGPSRIEKLDGLSMCRNLTTLYIGNNKLKSFDELLKLKDLPKVRKGVRV